MIFSIKVSRKILALASGVLLVGFIAVLPAFFGLRDKLAAVQTQGSRLVPIYYVETPEKKVAISFDASWGAERTPLILEVLREHNLKTTFFLTGIWINDYPDWVKKIWEEGHEIGNHTASHPHLNQLSPEQIREELQAVEDKVFEITGQRTTLFRPPFGEYNNTVITTIEAMEYKVIQWSIDSLDWKDLSKEAIFDRVTERAHYGAIILFHNDGLNTPAALPDIIEFFHKNGYEIVPISSLIYHSDYEIDPHTGGQRPKR